VQDTEEASLTDPAGYEPSPDPQEQPQPQPEKQSGGFKLPW
jgi:hypothetical protein